MGCCGSAEVSDDACDLSLARMYRISRGWVDTLFRMLVTLSRTMWYIVSRLTGRWSAVRSIALHVILLLCLSRVALCVCVQQICQGFVFASNTNKVFDFCCTMMHNTLMWCVSKQARRVSTGTAELYCQHELFYCGCQTHGQQTLCFLLESINCNIV